MYAYVCAMCNVQCASDSERADANRKPQYCDKSIGMPGLLWVGVGLSGICAVIDRN